jgi:hypothetical protein
MYHNIYGFNSKYDETKSGKICIKKISELDYNFHPVRGGVILYYDSNNGVKCNNIESFLQPYNKTKDVQAELEPILEQKFPTGTRQIPITPINKKCIINGEYKNIMNVGFSEFLKSETFKEYIDSGKPLYLTIPKKYDTLSGLELFNNSEVQCVPKLRDSDSLEHTYTIFKKNYNCDNSELIRKSNRYFLVGKDFTYKTLTDFGGTIEYKKDRDPVVGALRELNEETLGLFTYSKESVLDSYCIYNNYLFIIFIKIPQNPNLQITQFEKIKSEYSKIEVDSLNLFEESDFIKLLKIPYVVYEPVRSLLDTKAETFFKSL